MCSIMGYCGSGADFGAFQRGFDRTLSRGPDDTRVVDVGKGLLGFHRLAIMGLDSTGMQPFQLGEQLSRCATASCTALTAMQGPAGGKGLHLPQRQRLRDPPAPV